MRVLFLGEIVGKAGHFTIKNVLPMAKETLEVDFVVANGNGATGGFGMGKNHAMTLRKRGVDVLTSGECVYYKKDMVEFIAKAPWILRPANMPPGIPGRGWGIYETPEADLAIISMIGQSGFNRLHANNPFTYIPEVVKRVKERTSAVILNFHAATTAEKRTMAYHVDGSIAAMIGTGGRCLTADAEILPGGTATITDCGRTGSLASVWGMDSETELRILTSRIPERSQDGWGNLRLQGVLVDIAENGSAQSIETVDIPCEEEGHDPNSHGG